MRSIDRAIAVVIAVLCSLAVALAVSSLPLGPGLPATVTPDIDYLITPFTTKSSWTQTGEDEWTLQNGLIQRTFSVAPNFATIGYRHSLTQQNVWRAGYPEASFTTANGTQIMVGGVTGQRHPALYQPYFYPPATDPNAYQFVNFTTGPITPSFAWAPTRNSETREWPAPGIHLTVLFQPGPTTDPITKGLYVKVHYAIYDSIPVLHKWVEFYTLNSQTNIYFTNVTVEWLTLPEAAYPYVSIETDYMPRSTQWDQHFAALSSPYLDTSNYYLDPVYWNNHDSQFQGDLEWYYTLVWSHYHLGPSVNLTGSTLSWSSYRVLELIHDSLDLERQNLARRRWMRTLAPQGTENVLHFHYTDAAHTPAGVDQVVASGFEMLILSFYSGFDPSSNDPKYIQQVTTDFEYAHNYSILVGGYTLMQNPYNLNNSNAAIDPISHSSAGIACFATLSHREYRNRIINFIIQTKMDMIETDGPYEGQACESNSHELHNHLDDSQYMQTSEQQSFYRQLKELKNLYINAPDPYWLSSGSNHEPIGYTDQWGGTGGWEYIDLGRMYAYDGTQHYPTMMGWAAHNLGGYTLQQYEWAMAQYTGNGIITCYRGNQLYANDDELKVVNYWTTFFKLHRSILNADIIHIQRPNGINIDVTVHQLPASYTYLPKTSERALGFLFNSAPINRTDVRIKIPLYYAGIIPGQQVRVEWGTGIVVPFPVKGTTSYIVDMTYSIDLYLTSLPARQFVYFIITEQQEEHFAIELTNPKTMTV